MMADMRTFISKIKNKCIKFVENGHIFKKKQIQIAPCGTQHGYCFFSGTDPVILAISLVFI